MTGASQTPATSWRLAFPFWDHVEEQVPVSGESLISDTSPEDRVETVLELASAFRVTGEPALGELYPLIPAQFGLVLDAGHGQCWLSRDAVAALVVQALRHSENERCLLRAWCVMANHVHAVVQPLGRWTLSKLLHSWKSWTAKEAARLIGPDCPARFWMPESYNHWCRDAGEVDRCVRYTLMNPVKAGLSPHPADYPWCGPHP